MINQPYFSIGVTTFDRLELLIETIASILSQSFIDFEVLIGNDNPTEPLTQQMLRISDPRVRILNYPVNLGEIRNMSNLLGESRGRYFTWLADDDLYHENFLEAIHCAHKQYGEELPVFTGYETGIRREVSRPVRDYKISRVTGRHFLSNYLNGSFRTLGCYGVFRTTQLRASGGIAQLGLGFSPYSDNLIAIKAGAQDYLCLIDTPLIFFRTHAASISYSSPDANAYFTAQKELFDRAWEVLQLPQLKDDFQINLYNLLSYWFMTSMFHVLQRRTDRHPTIPLKAYLGTMCKQSKSLDLRNRARLLLLAMDLLFKHVIFLVRRQIY